MPITLSRRGATEPFHAMDVLARANRLRAAGHAVVSLAVGQPSDPAPAIVLEAARRALAEGRIGYTDSLGMMDLRAAIADHYRDHYGVDVPVERVVVTTGSSAAFNLAFLGLFDAGARVAIAAPGYPAYRNIMSALGIVVVEIDATATGNLTADHLREAHRESSLDGVLFASPANPTGAVIAKDELEAILSFCREAGITAISDEIYHRLSFTGPDVTALSIDPDATVINSFSKYYCMTGWRIGWMIVPEAAVRQVECLQQSLYISPPELSQIAAIEAFSATAELDLVKERYRASRALLAERLPGLGLPLAAPMDGGFYAYCDISRHSNDSMDFANRALDEAHVAITPGIDFDPSNGGRTVRLSYAGSTQDMETAMDRLAEWLKS